MSGARFAMLLRYYRFGLIGLFLALLYIVLAVAMDAPLAAPGWLFALVLGVSVLMAGVTGAWIMAAYRRVWPWVLLAVFVACYGMALFGVGFDSAITYFVLRSVGLAALGVLMWTVQFMGPGNHEGVFLRRPSAYR